METSFSTWRDTLNDILLDTWIMQTMLPQAMVVYDVSWHLTWVLSSAETHGACVQYKLILKCVLRYQKQQTDKTITLQMRV